MKPKTILVSGLAATFPLGGVAWDYIQYLHGFHRLGHDVYYLEDTGSWAYDPVNSTYTDDYAYHIDYLRSFLRRLDPALENRFCVRDPGDGYHGLSKDQLMDVVKRADVIFNISATCWMRDEYLKIPVKVLIDSDPLYTQSDIPAYLDGTLSDEGKKNIEGLLAHDVFFTFGENFGAPDCLVPKGLFDWKPTRQPMVLGSWATAARPTRDAFTTVLSWTPTTKPGPTVNGVTYGAKNVEFEKLIDLPQKTSAYLELALSGQPPVDELTAKGWHCVNGFTVSKDPWVYRDYLTNSFAEFSTAKNAYVASRSGWFSCRSSCYLAAGRPCVVQDTGFSKFMDCGEGLIAYSTEDEALAGIESVRSDWERHSKAAVDFARRYFDSDAVLTRLLSDALS